MQATQKGFILALATFIMWGVFPIFFKFIEGIAATEVLAHRIIWSALILLVILIITKRLNSVKRIAKIKKVTLTLAITGALIASNWGVFIYAINQNEILATSLGYFINPLFSILLGAIILKEELSPALKLSIFIVFIAIGVQIYAIGNLPLISIILPLSFALYGLLRKRLGVRTFEGLFIETMILTPFALLYLLYLAINNSSEFGINFNGIMLFLSGFVTILPLLTFNASTKYLKLSTIGFLQYISPTLSMIIAVFIYNETLDFYKIIINNAFNYLKNNGKLFLEIGYNQKDKLFELIEKSNNLFDDIDEIIRRALKVKNDVVFLDPKEKNIRRVLNFGHTIGHAIESLGKFNLLHGECVGLGMMYILDGTLKERVKKVLEKYNLPTSCNINKDELYNYILRDKKRSAEYINIVKGRKYVSAVFRNILGIFEGVCRRRIDLYDSANRYQFYRFNGGEDTCYLYACGGSIARAWFISIPCRFCGSRGYCAN